MHVKRRFAPAGCGRRAGPYFLRRSVQTLRPTLPARLSATYSVSHPRTRSEA